MPACLALTLELTPQIDFLPKRYFNGARLGMRYPRARFNFASKGKEKQEPSARVIAGSILSSVILLSLLAFVLFGGHRFFFGLVRAAGRSDPAELWAEQRYQDLIAEAETRLSENPMDRNALIYSGFARFYAGQELVDEEQRLEYMQAAIRNLRKALLHDRDALRGELYYVLSKAYFHTGPFYYDLSVEYMQRALDHGYEAPDAQEYLAVAYSDLGRHERAAESLKAAVAENPNDLLYFTLAETRIELEQPAEAEQAFERVLELSDDPYLLQQAQLRLAELLIEESRYDEALEQVEQVLASNEDSAHAYYLRGRLHLAQNDRERARAQWREAVRLDPQHTEALRSLQNN